jgi:hypothetical protein
LIDLIGGANLDDSAATPSPLWHLFFILPSSSSFLPHFSLPHFHTHTYTLSLSQHILCDGSYFTVLLRTLLLRACNPSRSTAQAVTRAHPASAPHLKPLAAASGLTIRSFLPRLFALFRCYNCRRSLSVRFCLSGPPPNAAALSRFVALRRRLPNVDCLRIVPLRLSCQAVGNTSPSLLQSRTRPRTAKTAGNTGVV